MSPTAFQVLDRAIDAGGDNLGGKAIAGTGKAASALLEELCASSLLSKTDGRAAKYSVTSEGRLAWEQQASPERRQQQQERERAQQRKHLIELLSLIQQKQGKVFTKKEATRFPTSLRQEACDRKLAESGMKANSYRLLPTGEEFLQADQPLDIQIQRFRQLQQQALVQWRSAQQRLRQELKTLNGSVKDSVQAAADELIGRANHASQQFDLALTELSAFPTLLAAARQLRQEVELACRESLRRLESEKSRLAELEARLHQGIEQQREQLEAFERQIKERLDEQTGQEKCELQPPRQPGSQPIPSHDTIWDSTRSACATLKQANIRIGGIIKIPELTDAVCKVVPGLSATAFHDLLRGWQQEDRLTLQLCNDPRLGKYL